MSVKVSCRVALELEAIDEARDDAVETGLVSDRDVSARNGDCGGELEGESSSIGERLRSLLDAYRGWVGR